MRMFKFWRFINHIAEVVALLWSVLLLAAMLLWLVKRTSAAAVVSTCGAGLVVAAQYLRHPLPFWRPAVHPAYLFFAYSYGLEFGGLLVAAGLFWHFAGFKRGS